MGFCTRNFEKIHEAAVGLCATPGVLQTGFLLRQPLELLGRLAG